MIDTLFVLYLFGWAMFYLAAINTDPTATTSGVILYALLALIWPVMILHTIILVIRSRKS